jgi:hypothetical protein
VASLAKAAHATAAEKATAEPASFTALVVQKATTYGAKGACAVPAATAVTTEGLGNAAMAKEGRTECASSSEAAVHKAATDRAQAGGRTGANRVRAVRNAVQSLKLVSTEPVRTKKDCYMAGRASDRRVSTVADLGQSRLGLGSHVIRRLARHLVKSTNSCLSGIRRGAVAWRKSVESSASKRMVNRRL